jgi:nitrogen fixation-related uncharacterized protein
MVFHAEIHRSRLQILLVISLLMAGVAGGVLWRRLGDKAEDDVTGVV